MMVGCLHESCNDSLLVLCSIEFGSVSLGILRVISGIGRKVNRRIAHPTLLRGDTLGPSVDMPPIDQ